MYACIFENMYVYTVCMHAFTYVCMNVLCILTNIRCVYVCINVLRKYDSWTKDGKNAKHALMYVCMFGKHE